MRDDDDQRDGPDPDAPAPGTLVTDEARDADPGPTEAPGVTAGTEGVTQTPPDVPSASEEATSATPRVTEQPPLPERAAVYDLDALDLAAADDPAGAQAEAEGPPSSVPPAAAEAPPGHGDDDPPGAAADDGIAPADPPADPPADALGGAVAPDGADEPDEVTEPAEAPIEAEPEPAEPEPTEPEPEPAEPEPAEPEPAEPEPTEPEPAEPEPAEPEPGAVAPTVEEAEAAPGPAEVDDTEPTAATPTLQIRIEHETVDLEDADAEDDFDPADYLADPLVGQIPWDEDDAPERGPLRIAIGGGGGGVGRTLLAANLALILARLGHRCTLVDADPVGAGLHTALGLPPRLPRPRPARVDVPPVEPVPGSSLGLLRPARSLVGPADPHRLALLEAADRRDDGIQVLDLGAQADGLTLERWLGADVALVVAEPLPAAIERVYAFIGAALWRRALTGTDEPTRAARALIESRPDIDGPRALTAALQADHPDAARAIGARLLTFRPRLVMNRTHTRVDREMGPAMVSALRRRWGVTADFVGAIDHDDAARDAARRRRPMVLAYPGASYSQAVDKMAPRLYALAAESR